MTVHDESQQLRRARLKLVFMFLTPVAVTLLATLVFYSGVGIPRSELHEFSTLPGSFDLL